jgi:hypothetical protein
MQRTTLIGIVDLPSPFGYGVPTIGNNQALLSRPIRRHFFGTIRRRVVMRSPNHATRRATFASFGGTGQPSVSCAFRGCLDAPVGTSGDANLRM